MQRYCVEVFAPHYGVSCRYFHADSHAQALADRLTKEQGLPEAGRGYAVVVPISWEADHWCDNQPVAFFQWSLGEGGPTIKPTRNQRVLGHGHARRHAERPVRAGENRLTRPRLGMRRT